MSKRNNADEKKRFGNERDVAAIYGISAKTLQQHRFFGKGLPFYRFNGRIFYDLDEVETVIRGGRVEVGK